MPVLKNARHEKFAQGLVKGLGVCAAYVAAGYKENRSSASKLQTNPNICKRVEELKQNIAEKAEWSAAERLQALKRISDTSEKEDARVAVSAIAEANKMQGSYAPSKHEHSGKNGGPIQTLDVSKLDGMEDEELEALERALVKLGASASDQGGEAEKGSE